MKKKILSVGHMQFPLGQAQVQRQLLIARAILQEEIDVTVLCRYGIHREEDGIAIEGIFEGVHYLYCSGCTVRPEGFIRRNYLKFKGLLNEIEYYREARKSGQLAGAIVSTNRFYNIVFYYLLGRIFGTVTVVDNVEYWSSNGNIKGFLRVDNFLYDRFYFHFADRIICISDFLAGRVKGPARGKVVKIPAITDFEKFKDAGSHNKADFKFFLFCGSKAYFEVIEFVICSFEMLDRDGVKLILVTENTRVLSDRIAASSKKERILVYSGIPYDELVKLYIKSEALIIPMRDSDQDRARFPHKISEYCASRRPIITNGVGETSNYFCNANAFFCQDYDIHEYAAAMDRVIANPDLATMIGRSSFMTGRLHFSYNAYSKAIVNLFDKR